MKKNITLRVEGTFLDKLNEAKINKSELFEAISRMVLFNEEPYWDSKQKKFVFIEMEAKDLASMYAKESGEE